MKRIPKIYKIFFFRTRDQHNQSEKSRRAHLKTCFTNLKQQLELRDDEKKKTSNLAILQEAFRQVEVSPLYILINCVLIFFFSQSRI